MSDHIVAQIASLGPHFGFELGDRIGSPIPGGVQATDRPWLPISTLIDGSATLVTRYREVQSTLAAMAGAPVELRVAASVGHLGLIARLVCPSFGAALLGHRLDLTGASWQPVVGGILPLSVPRPALTPGDGSATIIAGPVTDLLTHTASLSVSPKVLWGNVFSAVNGAADTVCSIRPNLADRARTLAEQLLAAPHLRNAFTGTPGVNGRRRSCCLIYRIAPAGSGTYCNDCILAVS